MDIQAETALRDRGHQSVCSVIYQKWSLLRLIIVSHLLLAQKSCALPFYIQIDTNGLCTCIVGI